MLSYSASPLEGSSPDIPDGTQFEPRPDDSETLWNVLEIVKEQKHLYLVKWEGIDPGTGKPWDPSWVPKHDCTDDLIRDWKKSKATKAQAHQRRKSKGNAGGRDGKASRKLEKGAKIQRELQSTGSSNKPSSRAGSSRSRPDRSSGKISPVVEIVHNTKRPREYVSMDPELGPEIVAEGTKRATKKRKIVVNDGDHDFEISSDEQPRSTRHEFSSPSSHKERHRGPREKPSQDGLRSDSPRKRGRGPIVLSSPESGENQSNRDSLAQHSADDYPSGRVSPNRDRPQDSSLHSMMFDEDVGMVSHIDDHGPQIDIIPSEGLLTNIQHHLGPSEDKQWPSSSEVPGLRLDEPGREDEVEPDRSQLDELGPDDAPDAQDSRGTTRPATFPLSAEVNFSLEANAPLTQKSSTLPPVVASPIRELNHALGLLNRKSEEIEALKVTLKDSQSSKGILEDTLQRLEDSLRAAEKRFEDVSMEREQERAAWLAEKERIAQDSNASSVNAERFDELLQEKERLKTGNAQLQNDANMLRELYTQASDAHQILFVENQALTRENTSLREQATTGVKQAGLFWETQVRTLEKELAKSRGAIQLLADQARLTDDTVRRRAALLPMSQRETGAVRQELEECRERLMELGRENTGLRIQVKEWEDDAMARRKKEREIKMNAQEAVAEEDVWMCPWMDIEHKTKCAAVLESRENLRQHFYEAGHI